MKSVESSQNYIPGERIWYVFREEKHFGPLSAQEIKGHLERGALDKTHFLWKPGFDDWLEVDQLEQFKAYAPTRELEAISDKIFEQELLQAPSENHSSHDSGEVESEDETHGDKIVAVNLTQVGHRLSALLSTFQERLYESRAFSMSSRQVGSLAAGLMLAISLLVFIHGRWQTHLQQQELISQVSSEHQASLSRVISSSSSSSAAHFALVEGRKNELPPTFIAATNIPEGKVLEASLSGISSSLVGAQSWRTEFSMEVEKEVFQVSPLNSTESLPRGRYQLTVRCVDCEEEHKEQPVFAGVFFLGGVENAAYHQGLAEYQAQLRGRALLELGELDQIADTLKSQLNESAQQFRVVFRSGPARWGQGWQKFSASWTEFQSSLLDVFRRLEEPSFREEVYFLPLYLELGKVAIQLSEYHAWQSKVFAQSQRDGALMVEVRKRRLALQEELSLASGALDRLAKKIQRAQQGLPPQVRSFNQLVASKE